jgi:hypothetical protein
MGCEIHCEGAPRDLGFDQGRARREELHAEFVRQPAWRRCQQRLGLIGSRAKPLARDLTRHFPQHSEVIEGLAHGAGLPTAWFAEELARNLAAERPTPVGYSVGAVFDASLSRAGGSIARSLAFDPLVRRSRPEGGFASVELTLPWSSTALAGVNEGGLAAASVSLTGSFTSGSCAAPAPLLVQDCLARFDSVGGALDWCIGRPAGGRAVILLADASGVAVAVDVDGDARREAPLKDGLALAGGPAEIADALRAAATLDHEQMARILGGRVACIDPAGRRVGLFDGEDRTGNWFGVAEPD